MVYFSALGGGEIPGKVLAMMPYRSTMVIYGALAFANYEYNAADMLFRMQKIVGFWAGKYLAKLTDAQRKKWFTTVVTDLATTGDIFGTKVVKSYGLADFSRAIVASQSLASEGKVVLHPQE